MFEDEARIGQKGRICHRWYTRGKRPPGRADQRNTFACIFAARPGIKCVVVMRTFETKYAAMVKTCGPCASQISQAE